VCGLLPGVLAGAGRGDAELVEVLKALSVQGTDGRAELRSAIVDAYGLVLAYHPEKAGYVAKDLLDWKVDRFAPQMRELLNAGVALDEASEFAVNVYLANTDEGQSHAGTPVNLGPPEPPHVPPR
jgi:hypothetical protein